LAVVRRLFRCIRKHREATRRIQNTLVGGTGDNGSHIDYH